jgi:acyl carrier protein
MHSDNPQRAEILNKIQYCLVNSLDIKPDEVRESVFLVRDLGATSLDVLDLMFNVSTAFNISIDLPDIQRQLLGGLSEEQFFNEDRTVTPRGYERIAELVPDFDPRQRDEPLTDTGLFEFIQVRHLVNLVEERLIDSRRQFSQ